MAPLHHIEASVWIELLGHALPYKDSFWLLIEELIRIVL